MGFFQRRVVDAVFRDNAEHPPLGRWLLGIASTYGQPFEILLRGGRDPDPLGLYIVSGRVAPATVFAALVALIVHATGRRYGAVAGASAGFALVVMPRVFAHAHFGALDTFITGFWTLALLAAERALTSRRPILLMSAAGAVWSLALLTKIHAWFLIPLVLVLSVVRLRLLRGLAAWTVWGLTGMALFFLGWPWLWFDPFNRLMTYLGTGVDRVPIQVAYLGRVYADRDVPWHYPWVYFAVTVPVGLHLLGAIGVWRSGRSMRTDGFPVLLAGSILLFLIVFSTRVPVYDGERLFLIVFPLWAIFIGRGFGTLWDLSRRKWIRVSLTLALVLQGYGVVAMHPFGLSYYNAFVGGLRGADKLGFERTYWGDAVDRVLLNRLVDLAPAEADAALVPTLYPGQGIACTTPAMARAVILLRDEDSARNATWVVVFRRDAYWKPAFKSRMARGRVVFERSREGVWLSRIYSFTR
jgi:4-amino-4-deoxy-L-arabinose transferase-like glycosyltransferase